MLTGSAKYQDKVLSTIGLAVLTCIALVATLIVANPFSGRPNDRFTIAINVPYLGQGIAAGTAVVLHGVQVGKVTAVTGTADGGVRLLTELQKQPVAGLTDAMGLDYRPVNYFGVAGVSLQPERGGQEVRNGSEISVVPAGNFTLSQLLSELGDVSAASLTPQLISVIDRVTRYTDGLNPLFETMVTVTQAFAEVQQVPSAQLLANTTSSAAALPEFLNSAIEASTRMTDFSYYPGQTFPPAEAIGRRFEYPYLEGVKTSNLSEMADEYFQTTVIGFLKVAADGLFGAVGKLLYSHVDDLFPLISGIKAITDTAAPLLRPQDIAQKLAELRSRFEKLYAGIGDQRAISVRIVLDSLPGVAAPLGIVTAGGE